MNRNQKIAELEEFIKENFNSIENFIDGLNKVGVKEHLALFGIIIHTSCYLNIKDLRKILLIALQRGVSYDNAT